MRYWTLEKGDVIGPFEAAELTKREGFSLSNLVCPESHGDNHSYWKEAGKYTDFNPDAAPLEEEKKQPAAAGADQADAHENISIEEYFETVYQNEDSELSSILGIPDEMENSDLYLGRFLQRELRPDTRTTSNTKIKRLEEEEKRQKAEKAFGQQGKVLVNRTVKTSAGEPPAAPAQPKKEEPKPQEKKVEISAQVTITPEQKKEQQNTPPLKEEPHKPALHQHPAEVKKEIPAARPIPVKTEEKPAAEAMPALPQTKAEEPKKEEVPAATQPAPTAEEPARPVDLADAFVTKVEEKTPLDEPIKTLSPSEDTITSFTAVRRNLKAETFVDKNLTENGGENNKSNLTVLTAALVVFLLLGAASFGIYRYTASKLNNEPKKAVPVPQLKQPPQPAKAAAAVTAQPAAPAPLPPLPKKAENPQTVLKEKAIQTAQNHMLKKKNVTVNAFLSSYFSEYLKQGYTAAWSSEPLHKDTYIVKYRLTKPRQEPIVYIFEVDTKKGTLTGALNNLTLDLLDM
ncbi:hypothetical protein AAIR98_000376 [Elusimicrobium simillimum]|uniref:hypothetical protein n=1 Tax=Elusimicrobium simillimum TaxID=3143438 RepID=UPI003C6FD3F2